MKINMRKLFRSVRFRFGVKIELIWKRKYSRGDEVVILGNLGKCN